MRRGQREASCRDEEGETIRLRVRDIGRAVEQGDIKFFELAFLEVDIKAPKKLTAVVTLKDFVIPK